MIMIGQLLKTAASGGIKHMAGRAAASGGGAVGWAKAGFKGLGKAGIFGLGMYFETVTTGQEYGLGAGLVRGAAYSVPYVGIGMMLYDVGKMAGDYAYQTQQAKRRSSFTKGFQDPFGNAATMRQRSQYNLNRGRASLGSEAYLFHS